MSWPVSSLGEVISFVRGVTFAPEDQVEPFSDGSTVVMRTKNVQVAGLDQSDLIAVPSRFVRRKEQSLRDGDILVSSANSWELVGKASYVPKLAYEATAGGFISIVRAKEALVDSRYLYHWMVCPHTQHKIRHCGRQTTNISNLDVGRFQDLEIPLPPLSEQKRIAAVLDKADAIRRKRQQAIQLADDFLRALFLDMFGDPVTNPKGWEVAYLEDVARVISGATPSKANEAYWVGRVPWVSPKDMKSVEISGSIDHVSELAFEKAGLKKIPVGSILIVVRGMILVHTVPIGITTTEVTINQDIKAFVPSEAVLPEFLLWFLLSQHANLLSKVATAAHGTKRFDMGDLLGISVFVPHIKFQEKFANVVRSYGRILNGLDSECGLAGEMFDSLSQMAFSGRL